MSVKANKYDHIPKKLILLPMNRNMSKLQKYFDDG